MLLNKVFCSIRSRAGIIDSLRRIGEPKLLGEVWKQWLNHTGSFLQKVYSCKPSGQDRSSSYSTKWSLVVGAVVAPGAY